MQTDLPGIAKQLRALDKGDLRNWLRRGELLALARELTPDETTFRTWLRKNDQAKTTAYKAMAAWRDFGSVPTSGRFSKEAMAVLAQSPAARNAAIEVSTSKRITAAFARKLVSQHAGDIPSPPPFKKPLSESQSHEEIIAVDGGLVIIRPLGNATTSDLLGMMMQAQRQLRDRVLKAA